MGRNWQRFILSSYLFVPAIIASGCASVDSPFLQPAGFQGMPSAALVEAGRSLQFTAIGSNPGPANPAWRVNGVAAGSPAFGTIALSGSDTPPRATPNRSLLITINSKVSETTSSTPAQEKP